MQYSLNYPENIVFGNGTLLRLPELIPSDSKLLLVSGRHAERSGLLAKIQGLLNNFETETLVGIAAEPPLEEVDKLIDEGRDSGAEAVIAVGGGSVIDAAKAAASIIPKKGWTADYFNGREQIAGKGLFFAALPTTAGTGAEITKNSVLTDTATNIKKSIRHSDMVADLALVDPELTHSCPPSLTAASGMDAFTQAVESYVTEKANAATKALAAEAVRLISANLERAWKNPVDSEARSATAEGSLLSAMSFSQSGLGAVHGLAHPLGSLLKVPHGVACSILLLPVLRWNSEACEKDFGTLARICGCGVSADCFIKHVSGLIECFGIPVSFKSYGLSKEHYPFILRNCRSNSMKGNPRKLDDQDIVRMLEELS